MVNLIWTLENQLGLQDKFETVDTQQIGAEGNFSLYAIFGLAESWKEEKKIWCMEEEIVYL